jgi:hypothetical protein
MATASDWVTPMLDEAGVRVTLGAAEVIVMVCGVPGVACTVPTLLVARLKKE